MSIVAIIPSRYGSTRFEAKPLSLINNKPMIQMVYERTAQCSSVEKVLVATDSQTIFDAVEGFGGRALMTSVNNRSGTDRVAEAAEILGLAGDDIIVNVQGDQPLLHPQCIDDLIGPFFSNPDMDMATLAFKIVEEKEITNPKDVKVTFDSRGDALYFSRSPIPFGRDEGQKFDVFKHLGLYAYRSRFLEIFRGLPTGRLEQIEKLEQLRALEHGYRIRVVVTRHDSPEVDFPEDIKRVEAYLKEHT